MGPYSTKSQHWAAHKKTVKFAALFGETDTVKAFTNLCNNDYGPYAAGPRTIPNDIRFKCSGIKKMRIRDGFYPVTRTVQIAKHFDEAYLFNSVFNPQRSSWPIKGGSVLSYRDVTNVKTLAAMCKQVFLEPLFGPGLLYNSIKSGIAVDWPLYAANNDNSANPPNYYCPNTFRFDSCVNDNGTAGSNDYLKPTVSASFNYGGMYMMGSSRCIPAIIANPPSHRLKFNALYDIRAGAMDLLANRDIFLPTDFVDLDRLSLSTLTGNFHDITLNLHAGIVGAAGSPGAKLKVPTANNPYGLAAADGGLGDFLSETLYNARAMLYNSAINNYLSETMEFYLADSKQSNEATIPGVKIPVIIPDGHWNDSVPKFKEEDVDSERKFFMEVGLTMGRDQVMCEGPRQAGIAGTASLNESNVFKHASTMRGYIYGPPLETVSSNFASYSGTGRGSLTASIAEFSQNSIFSPLQFNETILAKDDHELYFYYNLQDPAYQAYTPPYFYGGSSKVLTYTPENTTDTFKEIWDSSKDALSSTRGAFYYERYNTGSFIGDSEALCLTYPSTSSISSGSAVRMKIDASLEFSEAIPITKQDATQPGSSHTFYIAPWWTCPVLDFSSSYAAVTDLVVSASSVVSETRLINNTYHDITTGRGMWGGYGTDPYSQSEIDAVNEQSAIGRKTTKGIYITIKNIFLDSEDEYEEEIGFAQNIASIPGDGFYTTTRPSGTETKKSGSLTQKLGMSPTQYPIGQIASEKTVSEAIVVIPYLDQPIKLVSKSNSGVFLEGFNIDAVLAGQSMSPTIEEVDLSFPGGEIYSTREIIPGKHFLPVNKSLFNNMLSCFLTAKYVPHTKRGSQQSAINKNIYGAESPTILNKNLEAALKTDVGKMILMLMGDLKGFTDSVVDGPNEKTHNLGLQLPPEFDFIHNASVEPFQMIIMPFEHTFDKQDLLDMYQGIMPRISRNFQTDSSTRRVSPNANTPTIFDAVPTWTPYIPIGGHREDADFYKQAYLASVSAAWEHLEANLSYSGHMGSLYGLEDISYNGQAINKNNWVSMLQNFIDNPYYNVVTKETTYDEWDSIWSLNQMSGWGLGGDTAGATSYESRNTQKPMAATLNYMIDELQNQLKNQLAGPKKYGVGGEVTMNKEQLADIGLENFLCPPLREGGFLSENDFVQNYCSLENSQVPQWTAKEFYENLRFMVFKVKQRGQKDYKMYRDRQIQKVLKKKYLVHSNNQNTIEGEEVLENITFGEAFGTNWPYDYFSLIETAKIDIEFGVNK